jgi:hypothetical protein
MPHKKSLMPVILVVIAILISCAEEYSPVDKSDMSPLYVSSTFPENGAKDITRDLSPEGGVVINFSKPVDERYLISDFFDFTCNGVPVENKISISDDKKVVTLKLKRDYMLPEMAFCRVVISKLIKDANGLPLYISPTSESAALIDEDAGVVDVVGSDIVSTDTGILNDTGNTEKTPKDKRTGEGDYVVEFVTQYTPLKIVSTEPQDGAMISVDDIPDFKGVTITFNKPLNADDVNISNFLVSGEGINLTLSEDRLSVTIGLLSGLKEGKRYDVIVMPFVRDEAGISLMETYTFSFTTDFIKPSVVSIIPKDGTLDVDYKLEAIKIEFNKDMSPATITTSTIRLIGVESYSVRYSERSAYIENFNLKENRDYTVEVSSSIMDLSGFYLDSNYVSHFKTRYDSPYVKTIFPSDKASGVPASLKSIDIEFSEDMDFDNLSHTFFEISPDVSFSLKVIDSRRLSLMLDQNLLSGNTYTVKVKSYLKDLSEISMEKDFISTFTVSTTPDNNEPSEFIIYSRPITDPIEDLRKGFIIEWKAPASDIINGKPIGKVKAYRLVYSETPFDKSEFNTKTELTGLPTPSNPGDIQNIKMYSFIDKDNNEYPIKYNKPYYFMVSATDGTNTVYSNLLKTGILPDNKVVLINSKFSGVSVEYIENFNGYNVVAIGDTDEVSNNQTTGAVSIFRMDGDSFTQVFKIYGNRDGSLFGYRIKAVDINNDGCKDLVVSAPLDGENREGAVYIYPQVKSGDRCTFDSNTQPRRLSNNIKDSMFGFSISTMILQNKENLIVGAPGTGEMQNGAVYIYYNRANLSEIADSGDKQIYGNLSASSFGYAAISTDMNNDGCTDIIVSAPDAGGFSKGRVYVFYLSSTVNGCVIQNTNAANPDLSIDGDADYTRLGYNLLSLDLNGDNRSELVMSARDDTNKRGYIIIRDGSSGSLMKLFGEGGGNFGHFMTYARDYLKNGCINGSNNLCNDLFVSDEYLGRVYLIEGRENISDIKFEDAIPFGSEYNINSFGYSCAIVPYNDFETLFVSAPFAKTGGDFISKFIIYR